MPKVTQPTKENAKKDLEFPTFSSVFFSVDTAYAVHHIKTQSKYINMLCSK